MKKKEISEFKEKYMGSLVANADNSQLCKWLSQAIDFEEPDGYYFNNETKLLVVFEHFEMDCSERIKKNGKLMGSPLRKNSIDIHKEVRKEIGMSESCDYKSIKVIEQGYCEQDSNKKIYHMGLHGDKYRDNFLDNFHVPFYEHCKKIEKYKMRIISELREEPLITKVCFIIEDKTMAGTYYLNDKRSIGDPVVLTNTLQFQKTINESVVDYVVFGREYERSAFVGYKGDDEFDKIDLKTKEFFVFPAMPCITVAKKYN